MTDMRTNLTTIVVEVMNETEREKPAESMSNSAAKSYCSTSTPDIIATTPK